MRWQKNNGQHAGKKSKLILFDQEYSHEQFYKEYSKVAKSMREITKTTFGNNSKRIKQHKHPPIWFKIMRNIHKIRLGKVKYIEVTRAMLSKYFSNIEITNDWGIINNNLRMHVKILNIKRKQKRIQQFIRDRFENFKDNIGKHLGQNNTITAHVIQGLYDSTLHR